MAMQIASSHRVNPLSTRINSVPSRSLIVRPERVKQPFRAPSHQHCSRKLRVIRTEAAATSTAAGAGKDVSTSVKVLHEAAANRSISPKDVFAAFRKLEQGKLSPDGWDKKLAGESGPGRRWRLIFTTGTKQAQEALRTGGGGGTYIPFNAVQRWGPEREEENGVYLGHIASLGFAGPWDMKARKLTFDVHRVNAKIGPWKFGFNLPTRKEPKEGEKEKPQPFYNWVYVDDKICVARGRGGGLGMWARTTPSWELQAGVLQP